MTSPAECILQTIAESAHSDPQRRAAAQLALLTGAYDSAATVADILFAAAARRGQPAPSFDLGAVIHAMAQIPPTTNAS